jgi:hypothetical protein
MLRLCFFFLAVLANTATAAAALGTGAVRGDNCTPFNSFKVGYAVPGGTIVQQSVVLVGGWAVAGWILNTASGKSYYLPNPRFFDHSVDESAAAMGPPAFIALRSADFAALKAGYRESRSLLRDYSRRVDQDSPSDLPDATLLAPCFAEPLRV